MPKSKENMYATDTLMDERELVLRLIDGDEDAFCELYAAYKKSGITVEEFEGTRYNRIKHIKKLLADNLLTNELRPGAEAVAAQ